MRYLALACDYDGTIAHDGRVAETTIDAFVRLRNSGRKLILVTGRELDDLVSIFSRLDLFDRVVAENGALIYTPSTKEEKLFGAGESSIHCMTLPRELSYRNGELCQLPVRELEKSLCIHKISEQERKSGEIIFKNRV